jgi:hypothetical protein
MNNLCVHVLNDYAFDVTRELVDWLVLISPRRCVSFVVSTLIIFFC